MSHMSKKMVRTIFTIDEEYDIFQVWVSLRFCGKDEFDLLCKSFGLDIENGEKIRSCSQYETCSSLLTELMHKRYIASKKKLMCAVKMYAAAWDSVNDEFYDTVARVTKYPWQFSLYKVVISPFHKGLSNRNANTVIRSASEDPHEQLRITAHEILMIQLWYVFESVFGKKYVTKNNQFFWAANEITTTAMLGFESKLNALWSDNQKGFDGFLLDYPHIHELKWVLGNEYRKKDSFGEYLKQLKRLSCV